MGHRESIAARLRELRRLKSAKEDRDISQREVAEAVGVSEASISNWETARSGIGYEDAWKLADYYEVSINDLAGRTV